MELNKKFTKLRADIILIAALLILSVFIYIFTAVFMKKSGDYAVIKVDGIVIRQLSLKEDITVEINGYDGGINKITIENGNVSVTYADCPDSFCVNMGKISKTGETIVCLPHRVVVEIKGDIQEIDAVVN